MKTNSDLNDVAVGALGVGTDEDCKEGRGAVVCGHLPENLLEVILVPLTGQGPATCLGGTPGGSHGYR